MQSVSQMTLQEMVTMQVNQKLILQGISWNFYERLLKDYQSSNALRFAYNDGILEVEVPLGKHEIPISLLSGLIFTICIEKDINFKDFRSTTFRKRAKAKGVEPDSCFYIQNESKVRGLLDLDLSKNPPPDLVIEVDITSPSLNKLPIYASLGVNEVWLYKGEKVEFYQLTGTDYQKIEQSFALPFLSSEKATEFLQKGLDEVYNKWVKEVRNWINEQ
ncbi:MAG: Uma2 family endonuclease [Pyrinomonadaceae bacterium]|nr:Uma2 family endonuclease [Pyrinomonadaceae bacterium]